MPARIRVQIDQAAIRRIGQTHADVLTRRLADQVLASARGMVRVKTGAVASSGTIKTTKNNSKGVIREVWFTHPRSVLEHQGAKPHRIVPRRRGGRLVFFWAKVGHWVSLESVNHPGTRGSKFLTSPLLLHGQRMGFVVDVTTGYVAV